MSTYAQSRRTADLTLTCLDGGPKHAWERMGLDIVRGELRAVRRCVWCGKERTEPPPRPRYSRRTS